MKTSLVMSVAALSLGCTLSAAERSAFAPVSFSVPAAAKTEVSPGQFVMLVIEGPDVSYESTRIPETEVVAFVNGLLKSKNATSLGVYVREGAKFGEVVRAVDLLRQTDAKGVGVNIVEVPVGREL